MEGTLKVIEKGLETAGNPTTLTKKRGEGEREGVEVWRGQFRSWRSSSGLKRKNRREKSEKYQGGKVFT